MTLQKGVVVAHPGNFLLFRSTFHRLIDGTSLYYAPPGQMTGFLYSPTFAVLFAPLALLPMPLGLLLWNGANTAAIFYGLTRLLAPPAARLALALIYLDFVRSLQNSQSNAIVTGLVLIAFLALERRREGAAAGAVILGAVIKIFPLAAGVLGLFGPRRIRFVFWSAVIGTALALLPLLVLSPDAYAAQLRDWFAVLKSDSGLQGQSIMRILSVWFGVTVPNWIVQLLGALLLVAPALTHRTSWSDARFRIRFLGSLLVFLLIFNHEAESASFVVASTGVAIWYVSTRRTWWRTALVALMLLAVTVPRLFFFPYWTYHDVIRPNGLDVFPCVVIWVVIQVELWTWPRSALPEATQHDVAPGEASAELG